MTGLSRRLAVLEKVRERSAHGGILPYGIAPADQPPILARMSARELGVIANRLCAAGRMAELTDDMCSVWNRMADELKRCRHRLAKVTESFGSHGRVRQNEFIATHPGVWVRYTEAFERAIREIPARYVMSIPDLWGCW
jgi:hypothetical protein